MTTFLYSKMGFVDSGGNPLKKIEFEVIETSNRALIFFIFNDNYKYRVDFNGEQKFIQFQKLDVKVINQWQLIGVVSFDS